MELNTRYSGQYRGYNNTIPKYLQDKPRQFLVHCLSRISSAEDIPADYINAGENPGEFYVRSLDSKDTWYNLSFVGNTCMPKCSCPDFSRTGLLCKHFFAVFKHNEDSGSGKHYPKYIATIHISASMMLSFWEEHLATIPIPSLKINLILLCLPQNHNYKFSQRLQLH